MKSAWCIINDSVRYEIQGVVYKILSYPKKKKKQKTITLYVYNYIITHNTYCKICEKFIESTCIFCWIFVNYIFTHNMRDTWGVKEEYYILNCIQVAFYVYNMIVEWVCVWK